MKGKRRKPEQRPMVVFSKYGPYTIVDIDNLTDAKGNAFATAPVFSLCRCGQSEKKPYCDGSHVEAGFTGDKADDRVPDRLKNYEGKEITIHDNRGVCSHDGTCVRELPEVFDRDKRPWINPHGATVRAIIETVEKCPSGALSYTIGTRRYQDLDREPSIRVRRKGPLHIEGFIEIKDDQYTEPESAEHCTLCRCGQSKNKPFCDGTHLDIDFDDTK